VVSPLLHDRQRKLGGFVISSKVGSDTITVQLTDDPSRVERAHWLEAAIELDRVYIRSDVGVENEIDGRPDPAELTQPFRACLDTFIAKVTGESA
jgi:hypothetical protein